MKIKIILHIFLSKLNTFFLSCRLLLERLQVSSWFVLLVAIISNSCGLILLSNWQLFVGGSVDVCETYSVAYETSLKNDCAISKDGADCLQVAWRNTSCLNTTINVHFHDLEFNISATEKNMSCIPCQTLDKNCLTFQLAADNDWLCLTDEGMDNVSSHICLYSHDENSETFVSSKGVDLSCSQNDFYNLKDIIDMKLTTSLERTLCEAADSSCYWNPQSIVTGEYCEDCPQLCRNRNKSLSFVQACIALVLLALSAEMTRYTAFPMMSKLVSSNIKVC